MILKEKPQDFVVRELIKLELQEGPYSTYLLRKTNCNTEDVLQDISRMLRIPRKNIGYCGTKDKHAITEQHITILRGPHVVRTPSGYVLAYLGTLRDPLHLGSHQRNHFTITVRAVQHAPTRRSTKNFFGEQRFGTNNVAIGLALLRKEYKVAANMLGLTFSTDPISALRQIPRHTLLMYVHAVQSALWNELAQTLPATSQLVPLPGFAPSGDPALIQAMDTLLSKHGLHRMSFIDRSFPELTVEGSQRELLQDVQDLSISSINDGVCILTFSLAPGQYATETVRQLFE